MAKSITLVIPGLLDHLPDPVPRLPALETLLARGDCRTDLPVGYECTLMHLFGQPQSPDRDVPEGALSRYAQTSEKPEGVWLCASPVHLFADQSRVYLNTIKETALSDTEATQFIEELNKLYTEDGWEFVKHTNTRWYLHIPEEPAIRTTPLRNVDRQPIHDKLPQGEDALQWHRTLNEMQMLFHASPVNQARQERGEILINGVWLWGVGELPTMKVDKLWSAVSSDLPLVQGLAYKSEVHAHMLPNNTVEYLDNMSKGAQLVVHAPCEQTLTETSVKQFEQNWFMPLLSALKRREIVSVFLQFADGKEWRINQRSLYRFWRSRRIVSN